MSIAHHLWDLIPSALRNRPFGIYVSTVVFALGVYGVSNSNDIVANSGIIQFFIVIVSGYLLAASMTVLSSLLVDAKRHPAFAIFGEMYGWLFISAASLATAIIIIVQSAFTDEILDGGRIALWVFVWLMLFVTSFVRSLDILITHRGHNK